jgi:hypothetical protein
VLAQELEVGTRLTDGAEDDQVEPLEGAAGKRGGPAKAILDGPRCIIWIYGGDLLASPVHDLGLLFGLCRHTSHRASPSLLPVLRSGSPTSENSPSRHASELEPELASSVPTEQEALPSPQGGDLLFFPLLS